MRKIFISMLFGLLAVFSVSSQSLSVVKGTVSDGDSQEKLVGVTVGISGTSIEGITDNNGDFELKNVPVGKYKLSMNLQGFISQSFPFSVEEGEDTDSGQLFLYKGFDLEQDLSTISLSEEELLDDEEGGADNISGLLVSSKDAFLDIAN